MQTTMERPGSLTEHYDYRERRYNDTVTWLAEVMPGSMRTPFEYAFDGNELYASDGSAMSAIFDKSIEDAKGLPDYEHRRRLLEREEFDEMVAMMRGERGNAMVVVSDFPAELMSEKADVGGYNVERKQTMLRVLTKTPEGTLKMYSQSLDKSDRRGLEAIYESLGYKANPGELLGQRMHVELGETDRALLTDKLMGIYDRMLGVMDGKRYYAGRTDMNRVNTYDFVCEQQDLISAYLSTTDRFEGGTAEYNLAAAMLRRFGGQSEQPTKAPETVRIDEFGPAIAAHVMAMSEMQGAGNMARQQGIRVSGCGATLGYEIDAASDANSQYETAGYGNQADKKEEGESDEYGPLKFQCTEGHWNKRPRGKLISKCRVSPCKEGSVGC